MRSSGVHWNKAQGLSMFHYDIISRLVLWARHHRLSLYIVCSRVLHRIQSKPVLQNEVRCAKQAWWLAGYANNHCLQYQFCRRQSRDVTGKLTTGHQLPLCETRVVLLSRTLSGRRWDRYPSMAASIQLLHRLLAEALAVGGRCARSTELAVTRLTSRSGHRIKVRWPEVSIDVLEMLNCVEIGLFIGERSMTRQPI